MWWTLFIIFLLISIFSSTALFYALRRINQYENIVISIEQTISFVNERLKSIDSSGHFEGDDEVGFFFSELKSMNDVLSSLFEENQDEEN
tara:strand:- start:6910 stop:7179 length:270 start_codon:yes stop_codon:yes gene_type:complete